jgi:hypothetical protein
VEAPVLAGQIAGRLVYQLDGQEIGSAELRYGCTVDRNVATEGTLLQRILSAIFGRTVTVFGHGAELIAMQ